MNIKKLFIFPAIAMFLEILAMIFATLATGGDAFGISDTLLYVSILVPICLHVIALVGSLKNSRSMVLIGSCVVLFVSFLGNVCMATMGTAALGGNHAKLLSLTWTFFAMTSFVAVILMVAGFSGMGSASKNGSTFLLVASILSIFFYLGLFIFVVCDFCVGNKDSVYATLYSVFFGLSVLTVISAMLTVSILGIQQTEPEEAEQPGLTHTPKNLKLSKDGGAEELIRWKELLDKGVINQEEFDAKKEEILNK